MNNTKKTRDESTGHWIWRTIALSIAVCLVTMFLLNSMESTVYAATTTTAKAEYKLEASPEEIQAIIDNISADMDISSPSGISKNDFVYAMKNYKYDYKGILGENAEFIWELGQTYQVNEFIIAGVFGEESGWGRKPCATYNVMGIKGANGKYQNYASYAESFEGFANLMSERYIPKDSKYHTGGVLSNIGVVYCNKEWASVIANRALMTTRALQNK